MTFRRTVCALMLLASGCDEDGLEDGEAGELGRGNFVYECVNASDALCAPTAPHVLAVGARFRMSFSVERGARPLVIAPSEQLVRERNGAFQVMAAGTLPMFAVDGERRVIDILHLRAASIAELRLETEDGRPLTELRLSPGQQLQVTAVPLDPDRDVLGGAIDYRWNNESPDLLAIDATETSNRVVLRALGMGEAKFRVETSDKLAFPRSVHVGSADAGGPSALDGSLDGGIDASAWMGDGAVEGGST
jgi:hypothetical protein